MNARTEGGVADLRPYAPRGVLEWMAHDPTARHRRRRASLVFVDISGFTAMSERLARLGRVGAEEVTDLLNLTFGHMLAVSYEQGGSLLKFGGDALLLEFDGDDHEGRAVHAATAMRRALRDLQPLESSAGQVRLRMSVGVHTGDVDHFLVGSEHREFIVAGPASTAVVRMEGLANAGDIVLSSELATSLGPRIRTSPHGTGFRLRRQLEGTRGRPPAVPDAATMPHAGRLLSEQVRRRLEHGVPEAEHRPAVIGFVKFAGIDDLLASGGPEAAADALEQLVDTVMAAAAPDDVCVLSSDVDANGGKLILTAGVPTAEEFDGERMLRALRRVVDSDLRLPIRVGVNRGPVFAGVVGPWFRLTYTIIGDAVNTAARVMSHASPGELLATPEVLNRSQALFDVEPVEPFVVKGKREPLTAYRVGAPRTERLRRPRAEFRLVGRDADVDALVEELGAVEAGGRLVELLGPAGIGKSRLVDELHERCPAVPMALVAASRYEAQTPYHVVSQLVSQHLGLDADAGAEQLGAAVRSMAPNLLASLPLLGDVLGIGVPDNDTTRDLTPTNRAHRVARSVCRLLAAVVPEPAVLVVEDLHWADPESIAVIETLVRTVLPRQRWLLVLTARQRAALGDPDGTGELARRVMELEPLGPEVARQLVLAAAEAGIVPLDRGHLLLERAGGNPFFLQELLRTGGSGELPASVDALVQSQLDQLPPEDREVLSHAAVLGAEIDTEMLAATSGIPVDVQRRTFARLSNFVEPTASGSFRFRHDLVHVGAYDRLPFRRRRELHRIAADTLESWTRRPRRPDLLAVHTHRAGDWTRARTYSLEAAQAAASRFANLSAAAHYRRAIEAGRFIPDLPVEAAAFAWERLGDALMLASSYEDAVDAYRQAKRFSPPAHQVRLCGQIGQLRERQGRFSQALRWYGRAMKLDAEHGGDATGRMLVESGIVRIRQGKPREAMVMAERATEVGGDLQTIARISYVRAWAAMLLGEQAVEDRRRTLELFEEADDLVGQGLAYNVISMAAYYRGDWDEAATAYQRAGELRRRIGDEVAAAAADGNLGELLSDQGHFERARPLLEECRNVCAAAGYESSRRFAEMTLGRLAARVGDFDTAEELLTAAHEALVEMKMGALAYDALRYRGELAVFRGDIDGAIAIADQLDEHADQAVASARFTSLRLRLSAAFVGYDSAAEQAARDLLAQLEPDARDHDTALSLTAVAVVLRAAGDAEASVVESRTRCLLAQLGVVVSGDVLVFGPSPPRT